MQNIGTSCRAGSVSFGAGKAQAGLGQPRLSLHLRALVNAALGRQHGNGLASLPLHSTAKSPLPNLMHFPDICVRVHLNMQHFRQRMFNIATAEHRFCMRKTNTTEEQLGKIFAGE